jgi:hypothetical protein
MKRRNLPPETLLAFLDAAHVPEVEGVCVQWPTPGRNPSGSDGSEGPATEAVQAIVSEARRRKLNVTTADTMTSVGKTVTGPSKAKMPNSFPPGVRGYELMRSQTNKLT